eukprot:PITA_15333
MFLAFKAFVKKQSGHQILKLRSDNGREYVNNNFINIFNEHGIQLQDTVPYTPQQNCVAERKNHTLKEMANDMLQSKGLSLNFWAKAINYAKYIVNHTHTKVLKNITQEEAWSSIKPDVSNFRVFGSEAWAHIPDEKDKALEPKSGKYDASEDDNPPPPSWDPPSAPQLPNWMHTTRDATGALAGDPIDQRCTHSQFDRSSSLLDQTSTNYNLNTFGETLGHLDWDTTMNEEYCSLLENDTWDLVPLPKRQKLVICKWVYRTKFGLNGKADKHKACLVAKGFSQVEGIDYTETFSHVARMNSIHLILSLVASFKWGVHQM